MKPIISLAMIVFLCGCTASYVAGEAIASNKAVETETNTILVTNILRARDGVPTYYSDLSLLRGSLQIEGTIQAPIGIGDYRNWTGRSAVTPGGYVQVNPSFDIAPLNTQQFTKGINEPLDTRVFQYYLDRAIPPYTLLELFVDKIEDVRYEASQAAITPLYNVPCDDPARDCGLRSAETGERFFDARLKAWTQSYLFLHAYKLLQPYGPAFPLGGTSQTVLADLARSAGPAVTLRPVRDAADPAGPRLYRLYTVTDNIAFCVSARGSMLPGRGQLSVTVRSQDGRRETKEPYQVIRVARNTVGNAAATISESADPSACVQTEVYAEYAPPSHTSDAYTVLHFRSVDGLIEFLGRMLRVPPHLRPLKFDISPDDAATARFSVAYGGRDYHVHDRRHRIPDHSGCTETSEESRCEDRTLEVLTLVTQLLNLNKSHSELPSTPAVQVVQ
jgi:hypothetical protein